MPLIAAVFSHGQVLDSLVSVDKDHWLRQHRLSLPLFGTEYNSSSDALIKQIDRWDGKFFFFFFLNFGKISIAVLCTIIQNVKMMESVHLLGHFGCNKSANP